MLHEERFDRDGFVLEGRTYSGTRRPKTPVRTASEPPSPLEGTAMDRNPVTGVATRMPNPTYANIGPAQSRRRAVLGFAALVGGVLLTIAPFALGLDPRLRFLALPIYLGAFLGLIQDREKT